MNAQLVSHQAGPTLRRSIPTQVLEMERRPAGARLWRSMQTQVLEIACRHSGPNFARFARHKTQIYVYMVVECFSAILEQNARASGVSAVRPPAGWNSSRRPCAIYSRACRRLRRARMIRRAGSRARSRACSRAWRQKSLRALSRSRALTPARRALPSPARRAIHSPRRAPSLQWRRASLRQKLLLRLQGQRRGGQVG